MAFSPDGHILASSDGPVQLWDVASLAQPAILSELQSSGAAVESVAFSPDGRTLATGDFGGTIRLWGVTDPRYPTLLGQPLTGSALGVDAFGPDRHTLAGASDDGTTRLWNLNVQYAIERICATAGGLTPRQWNNYIPQLQYQPSCAP